jgi:hypothetical protein
MMSSGTFSANKEGCCENHDNLTYYWLPALRSLPLGLIARSNSAGLLSKQTCEHTKTHGLEKYTRNLKINWHTKISKIKFNRIVDRKLTLKLSGVTVMPALPLRLGKVPPSGRLMSKVCTSEEKKRKSSMRARTSPRHILRPEAN